MPFTDIHIHALFDVDDGAKTESEMLAMVDASYADGVRILCVTPHYHPGYFRNSNANIDTAYSVLTEYVHKKYPDLELYLYFLIPVKMKWLAILDVVLLAVNALRGGAAIRIVIIASLLNFVIFFLFNRNM